MPSCAVNLRFGCRIEGVGVDPTFPPLAWEAWDGEVWAACEVDSDTTGGLNRDGDVVLHVPDGHVASVVDRVRAGWLRARVTEPVEGQPRYSASPEIRIAVRVHHRRHGAGRQCRAGARNETLGTAEGVPGGRHLLPTTVRSSPARRP